MSDDIIMYYFCFKPSLDDMARYYILFLLITQVSKMNGSF